MEAMKALEAQLNLKGSPEILPQKISPLAVGEEPRGININKFKLNYKNKLKTLCIKFRNNKKVEKLSTHFKNYVVKIAKNIFPD